MRDYTHRLTHTHAHTHTCTHTHITLHTHTHTHTLHRHAHCTYTHINTLSHTYTHTHTQSTPQKRTKETAHKDKEKAGTDCDIRMCVGTDWRPVESSLTPYRKPSGQFLWYTIIEEPDNNVNDCLDNVVSPRARMQTPNTI